MPLDLDRKLSARPYETTLEFRAIDSHAAVAFEDTKGLVATTGPRADEDAIAYAILFAGAPDLAKALIDLTKCAPSSADMRLLLIATGQHGSPAQVALIERFDKLDGFRAAAVNALKNAGVL